MSQAGGNFPPAFLLDPGGRKRYNNNAMKPQIIIVSAPPKQSRKWLIYPALMIIFSGALLWAMWPDEESAAREAKMIEAQSNLERNLRSRGCPIFCKASAVASGYAFATADLLSRYRALASVDPSAAARFGGSMVSIGSAIPITAGQSYTGKDARGADKFILPAGPREYLCPVELFCTD